MAVARDNPSARGTTRKPDANADGYPRGSTTPGYIDYRDPSQNGPFYPGTKRQQYRGDPNARLLHSPGSSRGQQNGTSGKNLSDVHEDWVPPSAAQLAQDAAARQPYIDAKNALLGGDQAYQQAKAAGDMRGMIAAMTRLKQQGQQDRFVAQGGTPETWQNRYDPNNNWPVPKSPLGVSSHGPGRSDYPSGGASGVATAASATPSNGGQTVQRQSLTSWATGRPMGGGAGMIEGYLGDKPASPAASTGSSEARNLQGFLGQFSRAAQPFAGSAEDMIPGMALPVDQSLGGFAQALRSADSMRKPVAAAAPRGVRRGGGQVDAR